MQLPEDPELSPPPPPVWMEIAEVGGAPGTHALQHARRHPQRPDGEWALAAAEQPVLAEPPTPLARMITHTLGDLGRWPGAAGPDPMLPGAVLVLAVATLALVCVCGGGRTLRRQLMWCAQSLRWGIGRLLRSGKSGAGYAGIGKFRDTSELGITLPRFDGAKIDAAREEVGTPSPTGPGRTVEFEMPWSSSGVLGYEDEARALVGAEKFAEKFAEDDPGRWSIESEEIHDGADDDADDDAGGATARLKRWQQRLARRRSAGGGEFGRGSGAAWSEHEMLMGMPRQVQGELCVAAWVAPLGIDAAQYAKMAEAAAKVRARLDADADGSFRGANAPLAADFDVIREDVPRTALPGDGGPIDAGALAQLLEAHAIAESLARGSFGYVQGMADIGAFLLQRCAPWQAFGCLRSLVSRRFVQLLLRLDRDEWRQLSTAFTNLLRLHLPGLASHLEHVQLEPELYLPEWLMTLWTRALRPEARISSPLPSLPAPLARRGSTRSPRLPICAGGLPRVEPRRDRGRSRAAPRGTRRLRRDRAVPAPAARRRRVPSRDVRRADPHLALRVLRAARPVRGERRGDRFGALGALHVLCAGARRLIICDIYAD